jgi:signal transduction histidine kinase
MPDRTSDWSLRGRLVWIAGFALVSSLAFGGLAMYWAATIQDNQMLDARLEHLGATVLLLVEEQLKEQQAEPAAGGTARPLHLKTRPTAALLYRYQVWSREGVLLLRSHEAPESQPLMPLTRFGFASVRIAGDEYRAFSLPSKNHEYVIQVAENIDEKWGQVGLITGYYAGFLAIPFGLVFTATWVLLRRSLRSIDTVADHLRQRNPLDLTPVRVEEPPEEMLPILRSVDTLFARIGHALSAERRFTSVAAHEMRTPLAGLRAQAQMARTARSDEELQDALKSLTLGVDRASYMLDQLLDLARIEGLPTDVELHFERVDVSDVYQAVMRDLGPKGMAKQISFGARFPAATIECHAFAFDLLLRNLLANAILYTPVGGRVEVGSGWRGHSIALTVDDSGPGIRPQDREAAFDRFSRLGRSGPEGVGLGLSIVLLVVELHHAKIQLMDSPLGGLRVQVVWPQPTGGAIRAPAQAGLQEALLAQRR